MLLLLLSADSFAANVVMHEGESIHDFCWYPYMSSSGKKIFCFLRVLITDSDGVYWSVALDIWRSGDQCFCDYYSGPSDSFMGCYLWPGTFFVSHFSFVLKLFDVLELLNDLRKYRS